MIVTGNPDSLFWRMQRGEAQPSAFSQTFRREILNFDVERGELTASFEVPENFLNPAGFVQGGVLTALLDDAMGPALSMNLQAGQFAPFLGLTTTFVRAAKAGKLLADARVISRGRSVAHLAGELLSADRKTLFATATGSSIIQTA